LFTGIVARTGSVRSVDGTEGGRRLQLGLPGHQVSVGDSVAVNGVCLTAVAVDSDGVTVDMVGETIRRTTLGGLSPGDTVNIELPLAAGDRFDGHIVQGHVDSVGTVAEVIEDGGSRLVAFSCDPALLRYVVEKGSIAIDGVSLTVTTVTAGGFSVALIPHTLEVTTLGLRRPGDQVNLEFDMVAKYVERLLEARG
jgi:riboflavin synthase